MEMVDLMGHAGFHAALIELAREHSRDPRERDTWPEHLRVRVGLVWGYARLVAWAGVVTGDTALQQRAADIMVHGDRDPLEGRTDWPVSWRAAMGGLSCIACLALVPEAMDAAWAERQAALGLGPRPTA